MAHNNDWIHYEGEVMGVTEKAIRFRVGASVSDPSVWLPKSQIRYNNDFTKGDRVTIEIPDWLAKEKDNELGGY